MGLTNERDVGLPDLTEARRTVYDYYQLVFLQDGYPGKQLLDGSIAPHPLYGTYVIADYIAQYRTTKDAKFLEAARRVADVSISRMTHLAGALVFMYEGESAVSLHGDPFYSGLTQARYVDVISRLSEIDKSRDYREILDELVASLGLEFERGGVARRTPQGHMMIEEYVHAVPDYTLNGWLTATLLLGRYADRSKSQLAREIFQSSVDGICELLPLYDVPEIANSRYRLTGSMIVNVNFSESVQSVVDASVIVPGQGEYGLGHSGSLKNNTFLGKSRSGFSVQSQKMAVQVCLLSFPKNNSLKFVVDATQSTMVTVSAAESDYDPLGSKLGSDRWHTIGEISIESGRTEVQVDIPWNIAYLAPYPTNFRKKIGGKNFNQYQFIHIEGLRSLYALCPHRTILAEYADKWEGYTEQWFERSEYQNRDLEPTRYRG